VPELMMAMYRTAGSMPIFLIGLVVAAPLAEEFLFRGFLFAGLLNSRLGPTGAIALTALGWASLHIQYDFYGMATIAATGTLLGLIRWRTGSLWLCALLHGLMNVVAIVEVMFIFWRH
jgi:CAAX protease family protein